MRRHDPDPAGVSRGADSIFDHDFLGLC